MADLDFETRLERMFAQAPAFADADAFARRVEGHLDRAWTVRRWAIGAAGVVGGVIAAGQLLGSNVTERMQGYGVDAVADASRSLSSFTPEWKALSYLPMGTEVVWMGAALAVLAIALMATRMIEEF
jgi:hypothetical protein